MGRGTRRVAVALALLGAVVLVPTVGSAASRPPMLVGVDPDSGREQFRVAQGSGKKYFHVVGAASGLVFGEEVACGVDLPRRARGVSLVARDVRDGSERWRSPVRGTAVSAGPDVHGVVPVPPLGRAPVVVQRRDGRFAGLDPRTGDERWSVRGRGRELIGADRRVVLLGEVDGGIRAIVAFRRSDGRQLWRHEESGPPHQVGLFVAIGGSAGVVAEVDHRDGLEGQLRVVDSRSGETLWERPVAFLSEIVTVAGSMVVVGGRYGTATGQGFDARTGAPRWIAPLPGGLSLRSEQRGPTMLVADQRQVGAEVAAVDAQSGSVLWEAPGQAISAAIGGGVAVLPEIGLAVRSTYAARDLATGEERWRTRPPRNSNSVVVGATAIFFGGGCSIPD